MKLTWVEGRHKDVYSESELTTALDEVEHGSSDDLPIAVLTAESGSEIHIGLGHPSLSVLLYFPPGYEGTGSMHSCGDAPRDRDDRNPPLTFFYFTHHSEFPRSMGVSKEQARAALQLFLLTEGGLPGNIEWERD